MANEITEFSGRYYFLSNFYGGTPLVYLEEQYPTVEHAFQAAKCVNPEDKESIRTASTPDTAKQLGRRVQLRPDWKTVKVSIMEDILRIKFKDLSLRRQLQLTKPSKLTEGTTWHDNFWGNCTCGRDSCRTNGKNVLGTLLMKIRDDFD